MNYQTNQTECWMKINGMFSSSCGNFQVIFCVVIFAQYDVAMQLQLIMQLSYIFSQCNGGSHLNKENMTSCEHKQGYTFKKKHCFLISSNHLSKQRVKFRHLLCNVGTDFENGFVY